MTPTSSRSYGNTEPPDSGNINPLADRRVMLIGAHPDDETASAGASIAEASHLTLVQVTDGADSLKRALAKGYSSCAEYARARAKEVRRALAHIPTPVTFLCLDIVDQRAAFHVANIAALLKELIATSRPDLILTHAFEGGHPDHDATAFSAHQARRLSKQFPPLYEMTGYHRATGSDVFGAFIPSDETRTLTRVLNASERQRKSAMLGAFASQRSMLAQVPVEVEAFRLAPPYDFSRRPHQGPLYYEYHSLGMSWSEWVTLVFRQAPLS